MNGQGERHRGRVWGQQGTDPLCLLPGLSPSISCAQYLKANEVLSKSLAFPEVVGVESLNCPLK